MKFQADRKQLAAALKTATVPSPTGSIPVLAHLRIDAIEGRGGTGKVTVTGTNLDLTVASDVDADVAEGGAVLLAGKLLADLVGKASRDTVTIEVTDDTATIEAGGVATLRTGRLEDWPKTETADGERFEWSALDVQRVGSVLHAVSAATDEKKMGLRGVHFVGNTARASDRYRLAVAQLSCEDLPDKIVPAEHLARVLREASAGLTVTFDDRSATFDDSDGRTTWTTRLIPDQYPKVEQLVRASSPHELTVGREALMERLRWVGLLSTATRAVNLVRDGDQLHVRAASADVGEADDSVPCLGDYFGDRIEMNAGYLLDALAEMDDDEVRFELGDWNNPVRFRSSDWRLVLVVMPITKARG